MRSHVPTFVTDTLAALRAERAPMGARLDAIDLAIDNLRRVWPEADAAPSRRRKIRLVHGHDQAAEKRRACVLAAIGKAKLGLTLRELKQQTPTMTGKARSNALQQLKAAKQIQRSGKTWIASAA